MKQSDDIETTILLQNNSPADNFLGLTPKEIHSLLYETFSDNSPIQFRNDIDNATLDRIPLFRVAEEYLKIIERDKQIKLTPLGALPKKVMVELYNKNILLDEHIENGLVKLWKEQDCISIMSARLTAELAGFVKKANGRLSLSKNGAKLIQTDNRIQLFKAFFHAFTDKFLWSYNDGYSAQPIGQLGWAFSVYMLDKFGDHSKTVDFYAGKYLKAFPKFISFFSYDFSTPKRQFTDCYGIRTFNRFFLWFGFVTVSKQKTYLDLDSDKFLRTELIKSVFTFDEV